MTTSFFKKCKVVLKLSFILTLAISVINCSKDETQIATQELAPLQDLLQGFLFATGFDETVNNNISNIFSEGGLSFIPLVDGKITAITAKMPAVNNQMRVTIWDKATGTAIRTEIMNVATANTETTMTIPALSLVKDKEYMISFNNKHRYIRKRANQTDATYPVTVRDIKITGFFYGDGPSQTMPPYFFTSFYDGDCSFKFQK